MNIKKDKNTVKIILLSEMTRENVVCVNYESGDKWLEKGDKIWYHGRLFEITGIETSTSLTSPPKLDSNVGLVVKEYTP